MMNKWNKLAQFITLLSTFIALGVALYLTTQKQAPFPETKFNEVVQTQQEQEEIVDTMKTDVNAKIDTQNKVILEFDKRISGVESTQEEVYALIDKNEENALARDKKTKAAIAELEANGVIAKAPTETIVDKPKEEPKKEEPKKEPTAKPVEKPKGDVPKYVYVNSTDGLNLREKASHGSKSLGVFANGTKLTVIGGPEAASKYNWYKVKTADGKSRGWVAIEYTKR